MHARAAICGGRSRFGRGAQRGGLCQPCLPAFWLARDRYNSLRDRRSIGRAPGTVIAPVGHGGLFLGLVRGFACAAGAGQVDQHALFCWRTGASLCPGLAGFTKRPAYQAMQTEEGSTVAEGVRVRRPVRAEAILERGSNRRGNSLAIESTRFCRHTRIGRKGIHVEPTSAWPGRLSGPVIQGNSRSR